MGSGTEGFKQRRHDATAELVIAAAETAIARKGYDNVTMRDIAAEAGCTPGTLYIYFKNKRDLVVAILEAHSQTAFEGICSAIDPALPPLKRLRRLMETGVDYFAKNQNLFRVMNSWGAIRPPSMPAGLPASIRERWEQLWQAEVDIIREAQAAGEVRSDFTPETMHRFMHGLFFGFFESIAHQDNPPPKEEQLRMLWGFFTGGIGARTDVENQ